MIEHLIFLVKIFSVIITTGISLGIAAFAILYICSLCEKVE